MSINLHVNIERSYCGTTALISTSNLDATAAICLSINKALLKMRVGYSSSVHDGQGFSVEYSAFCPFKFFQDRLAEPNELLPFVKKLYWGASDDVINIGLDFELEDESFIEHILESSPW